MTLVTHDTALLCGGIAGIGVVPVTPPPGAPLSGFLLRRGAPSSGTGDPLSVRALAIGGGPRPFVLLSYDALGLGRPALERITARLAAHDVLAGARYALTATHTHSAPSLLAMAGEPEPDPAYVDHVAAATAAAVEAALAGRRPVSMRSGVVVLDGLVRNRRGIAGDGRVRMGEGSGEALTRGGPVDPRLRVLLWSGPRGEPVASLAHLACHPVVHGGSVASADVPGAVRRVVEELTGAPCLALQGPSADINPTTAGGSLADLDAWTEELRRQAAALPDALRPTAGTPASWTAGAVRLDYAPVADAEGLRAEARELERLATGDAGAATAARRTAVADVLNLAPDGSASDDVAFAAEVFARAGDRALAWAADPAREEGEDLALGALRLGDAVVLLAGAEVFAATGAALEDAHPEATVLVSTCAAPLLGYVPGDRAIAQGGYETEYAWRYYGRPRPWAAGSEDLLRAAATDLVRAALDPHDREPLEAT